jgi:hypothetical protein
VVEVRPDPLEVLDLGELFERGDLARVTGAVALRRNDDPEARALFGVAQGAGDAFRDVRRVVPPMSSTSVPALAKIVRVRLSSRTTSLTARAPLELSLAISSISPPDPDFYTA